MMKKLLNTLYVTKQKSYLHKEGETVIVEQDNNVLLKLPIHTISSIVCFGNVLCSPFLLGLCGERGIHVSFLTENGKFLARVEGPVSGNVLLRTGQMEVQNDLIKKSNIAQSFLIGKIMNCRSVIMRRLRDHGESEKCSICATKLNNCIKHLRKQVDLDILRGIEGEAANAYFETFNELLISQQDDFFIKGRSRRPPKDKMNALLSFLYTILAHDCEAALESIGLDPQIGFLHSLRPGRASLALDLMEEFRPILADRVALSLVNLRQIQPNGFKETESGAVLMTDETRKEVLISLQKKKKEMIIHPYLDEKVEIGLLPYIQAMLLARFIRGDIDAYPPFLLK